MLTWHPPFVQPPEANSKCNCRITVTWVHTDFRWLLECWVVPPKHLSCANYSRLNAATICKLGKLNCLLYRDTSGRRIYNTMEATLILGWHKILSTNHLEKNAMGTRAHPFRKFPFHACQTSSAKFSLKIKSYLYSAFGAIFTYDNSMVLPWKCNVVEARSWFLVVQTARHFIWRHVFPQTLLPDNTNPSTGEPYGELFLYNGTLNLTGMVLWTPLNFR